MTINIQIYSIDQILRQLMTRFPIVADGQIIRRFLRAVVKGVYKPV